MSDTATSLRQLTKTETQYITHYRQAIQRFSGGRITIYNGFHSNIGICGNTIPIGFNKIILEYFLKYLETHKFGYKLSGSTLAIPKIHVASGLGLSDKLFDYGGINIGEDYYFKSLYGRNIFLNWLLKNYGYDERA